MRTKIGRSGPIGQGAWPVRRLHGHRVRVSENLGPAVLGMGRSQVVLPRWAVACEPGRRRLIVLHEGEYYLRAGDGAVRYELKLRKIATIKERKAAKIEAPDKMEGGSR